MKENKFAEIPVQASIPLTALANNFQLSSEPGGISNQVLSEQQGNLTFTVIVNLLIFQLQFYL